VRALLAEGQAHLFAAWPPRGAADDRKRALLAQLRALDAAYSQGGLAGYVRNARRLLAAAKAGANPFDGCVPSVPEGERLDFGSPAFRALERAGAAAAADAAFVLVAGGLGERLGFSGIKIALPLESASGASFLQHYCESILALQARARRAGRPDAELPLAIMTSDDTHARTEALLAAHANFGMAEGQVTLLKQEKVACLADADARLAADPADAYRLLTKPHGHGDVHLLLHTSGLAARWAAAGRAWVAFFQDTNGQAFRALPAALGVSAARGLDVNSVAVPRRAGEAIGALAALALPSGRRVTVNVEYNQLDPLLRASFNPAGDTDDPETGFSPFPGNINQLVLKLDSYVAELERHGGVIGEFVNPKYADATRTAFKAPTRLECMMQDFPWSLPDGAKVGFTTINQVWAAYSPVKNNLAEAAAKAAAGAPSHSAAAAELDVYRTNCAMLEAVGASVAPPAGALEFAGVGGLRLWPRVAWSPLWAATFDDLEERLAGGEVRIGADAALVIRAPGLRVRGRLDVRAGAALVVEAPPGVEVELRACVVDNAGWAWEALPAGGGGAPEEEAIRGFRVARAEARAERFAAPGPHVVDDAA
jgi:UDP-sugar pyrophosphorylase